MSWPRLRFLLLGTLRRQIILGVALVHAVLMAGFVWDLARRQQDMLQTQLVEQAQALAASLSTTASSWVVARDLAGLRELVSAQRRHPELAYAMILEQGGRVLAHSDPARNDQLVLDLPASAEPVLLSQSMALVDAFNPVHLAGRHVGWVRVGLSPKDSTKIKLANITRDGLLYAAVAIVVGSLLAAVVAGRLTRRLAATQRVADAVQGGDLAKRVNLGGADEVAHLALAIDHMLDSLAASRLALAESEQRSHLALEAASMRAWRWEIGNESLSWVADPTNLYGPAPAGESTALRDRIAPEGWQAILAARKSALEGGQDYNVEYRLRTQDGDGEQGGRWMLARGSLLRDAQGRPCGLQGVTLDITERKQAQAALEASLLDKEALLKEVHHRVKNNLQVITSLLRLEAGRSTTADTKEVLGYMRGRIRTMAQLHESLYRSGTFASVDLGVYLGQVATQAFKTQELHRDSVRLTLNLGSVQAGMDQATAAGLLLNELVSNCLKHGFPEGRTGEVCVELQPAHDHDSPPDGRWCLRVKDTGVGLSPDFEDKRKASLGLQLVTGLSQQLGGSLVIDSASGHGARFSVVFAVQAPARLVMPP